jgi:O-antigen/teichoic acid export membrane protein
LADKFRRSVAFSFLDRYGGGVFNIASTLVLARLLAPADFGIFFVAMSVVMMIEVVRDFGVATYLVQEPQLTQATVRTVFTVSLLLSLLGTIVLFGITVPVAAFYGNPGLANLMPLLGISFLMVPFGVPSVGLLRRNMQFGKLAIINASGYVTNFFLTVGLAILGFGYMSLAWAMLICTIARTVVSVACHPCLWAFRPATSGWRRVTAFGGYASAAAIVNVFHDNLPQIMLGRMLGFSAVGLFGRAANVCQLPDRLFISALQPVLLSGLAEQARRSDDLKPAYLQALTYMTALQWPILLCLATLAYPAVRVMLGEQWLDAAPLVQIMALASLSMFPAFMTYPVLVAAGAVRDTLRMSLISIPPSVLCIFLASFFGLKAVAATQFVTAPLQIYVALFFVRRRIRFTWTEFFTPLGRSAVVALCTAAPAVAIVALEGFHFDLSLQATCFSSAGAVAGWVGGLLLTQHPLLSEMHRVVVKIGWPRTRLAWLR